MNILGDLSAVVLVFLILLVGEIAGRIKVFRITLGASAILICGAIFGFVLQKITFQAYEIEYEMSLITKLGTPIFISCVGLVAGSSVSKKDFYKSCGYLSIGVAMTGVAFFTMLIILKCDKNIESGLLLGILCGSLTTTPGLSTVCELFPDLSEHIILGYGFSYLFGVILIVLIIQILANPIKVGDKDKFNITKNKNKTIYSFLPIIISCLLGIIVDDLNFAKQISLGVSGNILFISMLIGFALKKAKRSVDIVEITTYKKVFLSLFLAGSGFKCGVNINTVFKISWIVYSILLTLVPIITGYVLSKYICKNNKIKKLFLLSGGMTSTPAVSILQNKSINESNFHAFSVSYIGSLITTVFAFNAFERLSSFIA